MEFDAAIRTTSFTLHGPGFAQWLRSTSEEGGVGKPRDAQDDATTPPVIVK